MCGEPSALAADDGHCLVVVEVERDGVYNGRTVGVAPGGDGDGMARHEVARIEDPAQGPGNGVHREAADALAEEDTAERIVAPHRHAVAVLAKRHFRQRDRAGQRERGAERRVTAVCLPYRLDVAVLPGLDADRDRDAPSLAFYSEQQPHLAAHLHAPQVRPLLDRLADSVGVHGAHAGPAQHEGQAVATPGPKGLQFRLGLHHRRRKRSLHRCGQAGHESHDQRERRNSTYPTASLAIHTPNQSLLPVRFSFRRSGAAIDCRPWNCNGPLLNCSISAPSRKAPAFRQWDARPARAACRDG